MNRDGGSNLTNLPLAIFTQPSLRLFYPVVCKQARLL